MTKCCNPSDGGGISLKTIYTQRNIIFDHLILSQNKAKNGGGLHANIGNRLTLLISNCLFRNGQARAVFNNRGAEGYGKTGTGCTGTGGAAFLIKTSSNVIISNTKFKENSAADVRLDQNQASELSVKCRYRDMRATFSLLNSEIEHTTTESDTAFSIAQCSCVHLTNTSILT